MSNLADNHFEDDKIEEAINSGKEPQDWIIRTIGMSHNEKYLEYLYPLLWHEQERIRISASCAIVNLNVKKGLPELKKRDAAIEPEEEENLEKAMLQVYILRFEDGIEATKSFFLSDEGSEFEKYCIHACYDSGFPYKEEDVELLCFILEHTADRSVGWIRKLPADERIEMIWCTMSCIVYAGEEMNILNTISDSLAERLCNVCEKLVTSGRDKEDIPWYVAEFALYLKEDYAKRLLKLLKGKVRGGAKKEYKRVLKKWKIEEEEL